MRPCAKPTDNTDPCGSGLARDGGVSVNINAGCYGLIAGKPAPTVLRCSTYLCSHTIQCGSKRPCANPADNTSPCGSGLARDGGVSVNINAGCYGLIAGKPAPTVLKCSTYLCSHTIQCGSKRPCANPADNTSPCGSGLARDGGVSVNINAGCYGLIAGKPAPTVLKCSTYLCSHTIQCGSKRPCANPADNTSPCGSGLARDGGVSANISTGCDGLIAGKPAPTVLRCSTYLCSHTIQCGSKRPCANPADNTSPCGSGLARDGGVSVNINAGCYGLIAGKPAPTVLRCSTYLCSHTIQCGSKRPCANPADNTSPCGSGLARDGGVSVNINAGCYGLIAGKPAPTVLKCSTYLCSHTIQCGSKRPCANPADNTSPCGSGLARDGGVSVNINAGCDGLIAGKPAPTGIFIEHSIGVRRGLHKLDKLLL